MRYTILSIKALVRLLSQLSTTATHNPARMVSTGGVALSRLEEGQLSPHIVSLIMRTSANELSFWQKLYATFGPRAWVYYLAAAATPARQYRASHVVFNAIYSASITDDIDQTPHRDFFWVTFWLAVIEFGFSFAYIVYHRWNNIPHKVINAYWLTELLESDSAVLGIGSLIQDPSQLGNVPLSDQWGLIAAASGIACSQMITGITGQPLFQDTAHNIIEAYGRPDISGPVTYYERISYGILRLLHTSNILTLAYSFSDALTLVFQLNPYLTNPLNALICAVPLTIVYLIESRLVLYALYAKTLPSWAMKVAAVGCLLFALNNAFFALNAFSFYIIVDRLNIENIDDSLQFYHSTLQSMIIFLPSMLVALSVFIVAREEYKESFLYELDLRAKNQGYNQEANNAALIEFYADQKNQASDGLILSKVNDFHKRMPEKNQEVNILDALTRPLTAAKSSVIFGSSVDVSRDSFLSVDLSRNSRLSEAKQ